MYHQCIWTEEDAFLNNLLNSSEHFRISCYHFETCLWGSVGCIICIKIDHEIRTPIVGDNEKENGTENKPRPRMMYIQALHGDVAGEPVKAPANNTYLRNE